MGLYPNILFHLTKKKSLYRILNNTFRISYARERILAGDRIKEFGAPMVSFSDLRLSELKEHIGSYGKFGIGLTKDWAIRKGLNPVMYASQHSLFTENFFEGIDNYFQLLNDSIDSEGNYSIAYNKTLNTLRYTKNYIRDLIRPGKKIRPNYVFANEREWRYVPSLSEPILGFVPLDEIRTSEQKSQQMKKLVI